MAAERRIGIRQTEHLNTKGNMDTVTIPKPINGHGHARQGELMEHIVKMAAKYFSHYFAMGNTKPPILQANEAFFYRQMASQTTSVQICGAATK